MPHLPSMPDTPAWRPLRATERLTRLHDHLVELSRSCREALSDDGSDPVDYAPAFERLESRVTMWSALALREVSLARAWVDQLRELSPRQRLLRIRNASAGFRGRAFELRLLAEARATLPDDPAVALVWAELVQAAAALAGPPETPDSPRLALAYRAAAHQALGEEDEVVRLLARLREDLLADSIADLLPDTAAELLLVAGALHTDRGEAGRARQLLERAVELWRDLEQADWFLLSLLELARAHLAAGELEPARTVCEQAAVLEAREPALRLQAPRTARLERRVRAELTRTEAGGAKAAGAVPEGGEAPE